MSEANELHRYSSSSANLATAMNGNDDKDDKHKTSMLKIPGVIKTEQQSVGLFFDFEFFNTKITMHTTYTFEWQQSPELIKKCYPRSSLVLSYFLPLSISLSLFLCSNAQTDLASI